MLGVKNKCLAAKILDVNAQYYGISSMQMMESAGRAVAEAILRDYGGGLRVAVFCGPGNNGGDGFVTARYLSRYCKVRVYLVGTDHPESWEASANLQVLRHMDCVEVITCNDSKELPQMVDADLVVEALLGTGASLPLREPIASAVRLLNNFQGIKVSVDVPCPSFHPTRVYALELSKVPKSVVLSIGIPECFRYYAGPGHVRFLKPRKEHSHKGENGIVLVIGGSQRYTGACILSAKAASMFCDLVYVCTEAQALPFVKKSSPALIVEKLSRKTVGELAERADVVLAGPGLTVSETNARLLSWVLKHYGEKKFVLDASALRMLHPRQLHSKCVVTPHAHEFKQLFGSKPSARSLKQHAREFGGTILLKGATDMLSDGHQVYYNFTGNAYMTAGGTGDVLAGMTSAFACKNHLMHAALAACFLNGLAGDMAVREHANTLNAEVLLEYLPKAKRFCDVF